MKKRSENEWREIISEYEESGETQIEWCKAKGVNLQTFRSRKNRISKENKNNQKQETEAKSREAVKWLPIREEIKRETEGEGLEVKIGKFTIMAKADFNERSFTQVCKALIELC